MHIHRSYIYHISKKDLSKTLYYLISNSLEKVVPSLVPLPYLHLSTPRYLQLIKLNNKNYNQISPSLH